VAGPSLTPLSGATRSPATTLLLPTREALQGDPAAAPLLARVFARGERAAVEPGDEAQVQRHFDLLPRGLPIAAITRDFDCADAAHHSWLRADPAHVRADMGAGRLLACGELGLTREEAEAFVAPLKPLFGDDGCPISVGAESRWYLALPRDARLPSFSPPSRVLGDDIFAHLPAGDLGRRWRRLLSEAQVSLHQHPLNAARVAAGKLPVNSVWFWGPGTLPDHVRIAHRSVISDDLLLAALARRAGVEAHALPARFEVPAEGVDTIVDLRRVRELSTLERDWIVPVLGAQSREKSLGLLLDFADGVQLRYLRKHRWRVWRRPASTFR
jgi:hypothetical protein